MGSSITAAFCKQKTCPSAEVLLLYHEAGLTWEKRLEVAAHLAACDFCGAEMQLLSKHPPSNVYGETVKMPLHLRRLAEALLADLVRVTEEYAATVPERARLTLTDA